MREKPQSPYSMVGAKQQMNLIIRDPTTNQSAYTIGCALKEKITQSKKGASNK